MGKKEEKKYLDRVKERDSEVALVMDAIIKKHKRKISNAKKKVEDIGCEHHFYYEYEQAVDNGYGKWHNAVIKVCEICSEKDIYHEWPLKKA